MLYVHLSVHISQIPSAKVNTRRDTVRMHRCPIGLVSFDHSLFSRFICIHSKADFFLFERKSEFVLLIICGLVFFPTDDFLNRLGAIVIRLNVILPLGRSVDASIGTAANFPSYFSFLQGD